MDERLKVLYRLALKVMPTDTRRINQAARELERDDVRAGCLTKTVEYYEWSKWVEDNENLIDEEIIEVGS